MRRVSWNGNGSNGNGTIRPPDSAPHSDLAPIAPVGTTSDSPLRTPSGDRGAVLVPSDTVAMAPWSAPTVAREPEGDRPEEEGGRIGAMAPIDHPYRGLARSAASQETSEAAGDALQAEAGAPATGERRTPRRLTAWQVTGVVITGIGVLLLLFFVYLYGFTTLVGNRNQHKVAAELTGNPKTLYALVDGKPLSPGQPVALLEIPSIGLKQVVVNGTSASDLTNGPGLASGTAVPGEAGTSVMAGRRVTYGGPFGGLAKLEVGDVIRTVDGVGSSRYVVHTTEVVSSGPLVTGPTKANQLLLVTSDSSVLPGGKLVVVATLQGKPSPLTPNAHGVRIVRLSLGGDSTAGVLTIVWTLLFLLAALTTVWAARRWGRMAVTYRLAIPVLLACGLLACESLAQWLPSTL
jgi:sortase A